MSAFSSACAASCPAGIHLWNDISSSANTERGGNEHSVVWPHSAAGERAGGQGTGRQPDWGAPDQPWLCNCGQHPGRLLHCNAPAEVASASLDATWFQYDLSSSAVHHSRHSGHSLSGHPGGSDCSAPTLHQAVQRQRHDTDTPPSGQSTQPQSCHHQSRLIKQRTQVLGGDAEAGEGVAGDAAHKCGVGAHQLGLRRACVVFTQSMEAAAG